LWIQYLTDKVFKYLNQSNHRYGIGVVEDFVTHQAPQSHRFKAELGSPILKNERSGSEFVSAAI
jgi:hypothetical protein